MSFIDSFGVDQEFDTMDEYGCILFVFADVEPVDILFNSDLCIGSVAMQLNLIEI